MEGKMAKLGYKAMLDAATKEIENMPAAEAVRLHGDPGVVFVDLRDVRELEREGMIPGAFHAPRGMLEFWIDPESPYHKDVFDSGKKFVFYCASGWRSALAAQTAQNMGLKPVAHVHGGYTAWKEAGGKTAPRPTKTGG
jgi:rhodanese-related sulfurtransferase